MIVLSLFETSQRIYIVISLLNRVLTFSNLLMNSCCNFLLKFVFSVFGNAVIFWKLLRNPKSMINFPSEICVCYILGVLNEFIVKNPAKNCIATF